MGELALQPWLLNPDPDWLGSPARPNGEGWVWCSSAPDILARFGEGSNLEISAGANEAERLEAFREHHVRYGRIRIMGSVSIGGYVESFGCQSVRGIKLRGGAWVRRSTPAWVTKGDDDG